jgi:hypothetical protein
MYERIMLITWQKSIDLQDTQDQFKIELDRKAQRYQMHLVWLKPADYKSAQSWDFGCRVSCDSLENLHDFLQSFEFQGILDRFKDRIDCIKGWNFEVQD